MADVPSPKETLEVAAAMRANFVGGNLVPILSEPEEKEANITAGPGMVKAVPSIAVLHERRGPPLPPPCRVQPQPLTNVDRTMQRFLRYSPPISVVGMVDDGIAWPLQDGGWAFQFPNMPVHMDLEGRIDMGYAVARPILRIQGPNGNIRQPSYYGPVGSLVYETLTGTVNKVGDTVVYHWCEPNVIVSVTPVGMSYYDDRGLTYRGVNGAAHYAAAGDVIYEGVGGVTRQFPDGAVAHLTSSGVLYQHPDGSMAYTHPPESEPHTIEPLANLGGDPFPGKALTSADVYVLSEPGRNSTSP